MAVDRLPVWTRGYRLLRDKRQLFALGDLRLPYGPYPLYGVYAVLVTLPIVAVIGWLLAIPFTFRGVMLWYGLLPACAAVAANQEVADGKRPHEWAASSTAAMLRRRFGVGLPRGFRRARTPRPVRFTARVWTRRPL